MLEAKTRLFKSGNSDAIRLNKEISRALNVRPGDELIVKYDPASKSVIIKQEEPRMAVSDDFKQLLNEAYAENKGVMDLLKEL